MRKYAQELKKYNKNVYSTSIEYAVKECIMQRDAVVICFGSLSFLDAIKKEVANGQIGQNISKP